MENSQDLPMWLAFLIASLASFRMAILLSLDSGPAKVFLLFRRWLKFEAKHSQALKKSDLHHGIDCLRCSSVWVSAPIAAYGLSGWRNVWIDGVLLALALSGAAILFHRAFPAR